MATAMEHLSAGSRVQWLSDLDTEFKPSKNYRRTSSKWYFFGQGTFVLV